MAERRTLARIEPLLGQDLELDYALSQGFFEDADLRSARFGERPRAPRDLVAARGVDNMRQAIANRLKTRQGELAALGHPGYGSRHHELIGEPNVPRTRNLIKLYVLQSLRDEPRIEKVLRVDVFAERSPPRDVVRIELDVRLIDVPTALNLVLPFSLEPRL